MKDNEMNNIYEAPKSSLNTESSNDMLIFSRFSTWYVLILTIITFSIYLPYWLYSRTKKLNSITEKEISPIFYNSVVIIYIATLIISIGIEFIRVNDYVMLILSLASFLSNILMIIWVFKFRNRLSPIVNNDGIYLGAVMTFFLQVFYLQYKLNESIDHQSGEV